MNVGFTIVILQTCLETRSRDKTVLNTLSYKSRSPIREAEYYKCYNPDQNVCDIVSVIHEPSQVNSPNTF